MLIDKPRYEWFQQGAIFGQDEGLRVFRPIQLKAGRESGYPYLAHGSIGSDDKFRGRLVENNMEHPILFFGFEIAIFFSGN